MNFDKGMDQKKIERQSMYFSIHKHLDLFYIVFPFSLNVT